MDRDRCPNVTGAVVNLGKKTTELVTINILLINFS